MKLRGERVPSASGMVLFVADPKGIDGDPEMSAEIGERDWSARGVASTVPTAHVHQACVVPKKIHIGGGIDRMSRVVEGANEWDDDTSYTLACPAVGAVSAFEARTAQNDLEEHSVSSTEDAVRRRVPAYLRARGVGVPATLVIRCRDRCANGMI